MRGLEKNCMGRGQTHKVSHNTQLMRLLHNIKYKVLVWSLSGPNQHKENNKKLVQSNKIINKVALFFYTFYHTRSVWLGTQFTNVKNM